jgi:glycosyltransferase involved in cell wall biosynthesis
MAKIIYATTAVIPSRMASSIHVMKMCSAFANNGNEVILLVPDSQNDYEKNIDNVFDFYQVKDNFKIIKSNFSKNRIKHKLNFLYSSYKIIKTIDPDIVYGRELYICFLSSFKYNTSFEIHSTLKGYWKNKLFDFMSKNKNYNKTIVISKALEKLFLTRKYVNCKNIHIAHDGADIVTDFESKIKLKGLGVNLKVGYIGHLYKGKGIEIIEKIQDMLPDNIEIHIVGGYDKDREYCQKKIRNKNIYFYGFVPQSKVGIYINSMDVCLLPNQKIVLSQGGDNISNFTSPLKMFEYMSYKKAIIVSDLEVLKEVLDSSNSILCPPLDSKCWLNALKNLLNEENRLAIGNNAYSLFMKKYTWLNRASNIFKYIKK